MGAVAKFAAGGKGIAKKDLALQAIAYGNVYVARVALGANPQQTLLAFREAERFAGPSLILAYSHCIAHGINMEKGLHQQKLAVDCGHWPLLRYNPTLRESGQNPFLLDSRRPTIPLREYAYNEIRYRILQSTRPEEASRLMDMAQAQVDSHWKTYENMAAHGVASNPYGHTAKDTMLSGDSS
jgi:pyruvate-ferredoxin/flavodoxin oxidoreductase